MMKEAKLGVYGVQVLKFYTLKILLIFTLFRLGGFGRLVVGVTDLLSSLNT